MRRFNFHILWKRGLVIFNNRYYLNVKSVLGTTFFKHSIYILKKRRLIKSDEEVEDVLSRGLIITST